MTQVIIYSTPNNNVAVCVPTGELPIADVLAKDAPAGAIIVDDSTLPQGDDSAFFDAWVLADGAVSVDLTKAKAIATANLNSLAKAEAQHRFTNASIGLDNVLSDADWIALIDTARSAITASADTTALVASVAPVNAAIEANK
jgi:hypothetical protein